LVQLDSVPHTETATSFPPFQLSNLLIPTIISCGCHSTLLAGEHTYDSIRASTAYAKICTTTPHLLHLNWLSLHWKCKVMPD
jgi:hypothetical protein